jgi:hypothetical protein
MPTRKPYPSDVSDEEWAFVAPYLALVREDAPQRNHELRAVLRLASGRAPDPTAAILDGRTLRSTPESGERAGYDGAKRKKVSKVHTAVDTLGHLLALLVSPADEQDREQVGEFQLFLPATYPTRSYLPRCALRSNMIVRTAVWSSHTLKVCDTSSQSLYSAGTSASGNQPGPSPANTGANASAGIRTATT